MNIPLADLTWRPIFGGDPTPFAWCITVTHLIASWFCFSAATRQHAASDRCGDSRARRFWFLLAALMFGLGLNKQLDLQTLLTMFGRDMARRGGWYAHRRTIQAAFVMSVAVVGLICAASGSYLIRNRWRQCGLAYLGVVFLMTFVVIRSASFHHIDRLLYGLPIVGNWMNAILEFGGSLLVVVGAFLASRQAARPDQSLRDNGQSP